MQAEKLLNRIAEKKVSGEDLAKIMNITPKAFERKMREGSFKFFECKILTKELELENPGEILLN